MSARLQSLNGRDHGVEPLPSPARVFLITAFALLLAGPLGWASAEGEDNTDRQSPAESRPDAGTLIVHVQRLLSGLGNLRFVLFDSEKSFLKHPVRTGLVENKNQKGTWTTEDLPYGTYAVLVHHDANASGTMERHWYGKPKEPTGASNDAAGKFGPPKFKNAKFQFETPTLTLTITIK